MVNAGSPFLYVTIVAEGAKWSARPVLSCTRPPWYTSSSSLFTISRGTEEAIAALSHKATPTPVLIHREPDFTVHEVTLASTSGGGSR